MQTSIPTSLNFWMTVSRKLYSKRQSNNITEDHEFFWTKFWAIIKAKHKFQGNKLRWISGCARTHTFKTAARNKSGRVLIAEATRSPPALYPQAARLFSLTIPWLTKNSAHETKSLIEFCFLVRLPSWCHFLPPPPPPLWPQDLIHEHHATEHLI